VFYVFPFYVTTAKLQRDVPILAVDTWLLPLDQLRTPDVFGGKQSPTARCGPGQAQINPEYRLHKLQDLSDMRPRGVQASAFKDWYAWCRERGRRTPTGRRSPWLARGLRIVVVSP
jgi:hypothetical protein